MAFLTNFAVFFIMWWVVLFVMLPIGLRTQEEDGEVTLGTVSSAPRGPHMLRVFLRTTIVTGVVFGLYYIAVSHYGFSFDDIPRIGPFA